MRSGRLLAEESPRVLLSMYHCQSLEEVFLKLSRKQGSDGQPQEGPVNISNNISLVSYYCSIAVLGTFLFYVVLLFENTAYCIYKLYYHTSFF